MIDIIDLAISIDDGPSGTTIVETSNGTQLACADWPQDSDSRIVAFSPRAKRCGVVAPYELAKDIALAVQALENLSDATIRNAAWYCRLRKCAAGALKG